MNSFGGGYICSVCGNYAPYGIGHVCPGPRSHSETSSTRWDRMSDVRIADSLERIATALEAIAAKEQPRG